MGIANIPLMGEEEKQGEGPCNRIIGGCIQNYIKPVLTKPLFQEYYAEAAKKEYDFYSKSVDKEERIAYIESLLLDIMKPYCLETPQIPKEMLQISNNPLIKKVNILEKFYSGHCLMILEAAVLGQAKAIITENPAILTVRAERQKEVRHILKDIKILTPGEFFSIDKIDKNFPAGVSIYSDKNDNFGLKDY